VDLAVATDAWCGWVVANLDNIRTAAVM